MRQVATALHMVCLKDYVPSPDSKNNIVASVLRQAQDDQRRAANPQHNSPEQ